jgi:hypothetical protein
VEPGSEGIVEYRIIHLNGSVIPADAVRERPGTPSIFDDMGPWPWYILSATLLALALFALLDLPVRGRRRAME